MYHKEVIKCIHHLDVEHLICYIQRQISFWYRLHFFSWKQFRYAARYLTANRNPKKSALHSRNLSWYSVTRIYTKTIFSNSGYWTNYFLGIKISVIGNNWIIPPPERYIKHHLYEFDSRRNRDNTRTEVAILHCYLEGSCFPNFFISKCYKKGSCVIGRKH